MRKILGLTGKEWLVVFGVIAICTIFAIPQFLHAMMQVEIFNAKKELQRIHSLQSAYRDRFGTYCANLQDETLRYDSAIRSTKAFEFVLTDVTDTTYLAWAYSNSDFSPVRAVFVSINQDGKILESPLE